MRTLLLDPSFTYNSSLIVGIGQIVNISEIPHFKKQPYNKFHPQNHLKSITIAVIIQSVP